MLVTKTFKSVTDTKKLPPTYIYFTTNVCHQNKCNTKILAYIDVGDRYLETKCVGDNYKMLVTVLAILVTSIHYLSTLASGTNLFLKVINIKIQ